MVVWWVLNAAVLLIDSRDMELRATQRLFKQISGWVLVEENGASISLYDVGRLNMFLLSRGTDEEHIGEKKNLLSFYNDLRRKKYKHYNDVQ